jgi:hypothetical protein
MSLYLGITKPGIGITKMHGVSGKMVGNSRMAGAERSAKWRATNP